MTEPYQFRDGFCSAINESRGKYCVNTLKTDEQKKTRLCWIHLAVQERELARLEATREKAHREHETAGLIDSMQDTIANITDLEVARKTLDDIRRWCNTTSRAFAASEVLSILEKNLQ